MMATSKPTQRRSGWDQQHMNIAPVDSDRQIAYAEYGCPDGVPVVFLHGTPGSHRLGTLLEAEAQEHGVRVLAPERPGYGRSSPWPNRSVRDASDFVMPVLDDADVQMAGLIAFSGGGPYALATAATEPLRVNRVDIISGATPPAVSSETPVTQRLLAGLATTMPFVLRGLFRGQAWFAERFDPSFVVAQYTAEGNAETIPDAAAEIVKKDFVEAFNQYRSGAVTEFRTTATEWGIDFDEIDSEVALWHGENDTNVPIGEVRHLEQKIPNAELHVLADTDHLQTLLQSIPDIMEEYR